MRKRGVDLQRLQLEAAVSLSAAIAEALHAKEIVIDLLVAGPEIFLFRTPQTASRFDSILEILATVAGTPQDSMPVLLEPLMNSLESISSIVFVTLDWDERRQEIVERMRDSGRGVRVLLVRSRPPSIPAPADCADFQTISPPLILAGEVRSL